MPASAAARASTGSMARSPMIPRCISHVRTAVVAGSTRSAMVVGMWGHLSTGFGIPRVGRQTRSRPEGFAPRHALVDAYLARKAEHLLTDDVALDLVGSALDG